MKYLICCLSLMVASAALAEEPAELVKLRQAWEMQRTEAQEKIDKRYFDELEELKKNFTQARNIADALAVDNVIKGGEKADNEPAELSKMRQARDKSLKKALTPLDKKYWQDLKKLKEDFIKEGKLVGVVATDAEIKKVLAAYKKTEPPKKLVVIDKKWFLGRWQFDSSKNQFEFFENGNAVYYAQFSTKQCDIGTWSLEGDTLIVNWNSGVIDKVVKAENGKLLMVKPGNREHLVSKVKTAPLISPN